MEISRAVQLGLFSPLNYNFVKFGPRKNQTKLELLHKLEFVMCKSTSRYFATVVLLLSASFPVFAHKIALKDGSIIQIQKYSVNENALLYKDEKGNETSIPLGSIDAERTRQLNTGENPPLVLPGLVAQPVSNNPNNEPSLGDIARRIRKTEPQTTKRVYTSEDFALGAPPAEAVSSDSAGQADFRTWKTMAEKYQTEFHAMELEHDQEAVKGALGNYSEIRFPERDSWERRYLAARERFLRGLQMCMSDRASEFEEKMKACSHLSSQQHDYDEVKQEGIRLARSWNHYQSEKR
jgi:hypothetical protein